MATPHSSTHLLCGITQLEHILSHGCQWISNWILIEARCQSSPLCFEIKYSIAIDWSGDSYPGLNINWQYNKGYVEISMPDYIPKALAKFKHPPPCLPQHSPHAWTAPVYWKKAQYYTEDHSPFFDKHATTRLLAISGTFLYYARAVDPTILPALNELQISNPNPQKKHPKLANNWWITYLPILKQFSGTMQAIWSFPSYPMLPIWSSLMPEVAALCYTLSPMLPLPNQHPSSPTGLSMYMQFLLQPLRLRRVVSSLVPKRLSPYSIHWLMSFSHRLLYGLEFTICSYVWYN